MPRAIPGAPYTIVAGDTLIKIAKEAYGQPKKYIDIWEANQSTLRSGNPNLIFPGEVITIPVDEVIEDIVQDLRALANPFLTGKDKDDFTVVIDGKEIPVISGNVRRTMDTAADAATALISWSQDREDLQEILLPYQYKKAEVYLGGQLLIGGTLYTVSNKINKDGRFKALEIYSSTADAIDSTIGKKFEAKKVTLRARAEELLKPLGIPLVWGLGVGTVWPFYIDEPFDQVTATAEDTVFSHLAKLASQRGLLISSTEKGEMLITKADTFQLPVGTIQEDFPPDMEATARFDGRARFNSYKAVAQTPGRKKLAKALTKTAIAKDDAVPKTRMISFQANESTIGNVQEAANWKRSKQITDSLTLPFPVSGWYGPDGNMWRENKLVTVESAFLHVPDGFTFLIRAVDYKFGASGTAAMLSLVPPQAYTGALLEEPWSSVSLENSILNEIEEAVS